MKLSILLLLVLYFPLVNLSGALFFVSPEALPSGDGTYSRPWTLQNALSSPPSLRPGDTVWIRGGRYLNNYDSQTSFYCKTNGLPEAPIMFRNFQNERVILDGNNNYTLYLSLGACSYTWLWGLEITNTFSTGRNQDIFGGITCTAENIKFINLIIHDTGHGLDVWKTALDNEIYGCIIYHIGNNLNNNGNLEGHGHGMYMQNDTVGTRYVHNNIVFSTYGFGIRIWQTTTTAAIGNFDIQNNILFNGGSASENNGGPGNNSRTHNFFLVSNGSDNPLRNTIVKHNCTYAGTNTPRPPVNAFGLNAGFQNVVIDSNVLTCQTRLGWSNTPIFDVGFKGNKIIAGIPPIYGYYLWGFQQTDFPDNEFIANVPTEGLDYYVFPNKFEPEKCHLAIYNWSGLDTVYIHARDLFLKAGESYELVNVLDVFNDVISGKVGVDGRIAVPMNGHSAAGAFASPKLPSSQFPHFGSFVLRKSLPLNTNVSEYINSLGLGFIYPNPSKGILNLSSLEEISELKVLNMEGQIILCKRQSELKDSNKIDLQNLPSGIYWLILVKEMDRHVVKLQIE